MVNGASAQEECLCRCEKQNENAYKVSPAENSMHLHLGMEVRLYMPRFLEIGGYYVSTYVKRQERVDSYM